MHGPTKANILLVDDRPDSLQAVSAILEAPDRNLVAARSGDEALRHILAEDFAVVVMDVQMPVMDGFETAALIRGRERSRHLPIVFITAHDHDDAQMRRAYSLGAVDFLSKPIVPEILRSKINAYIGLFRWSGERAAKERISAVLESIADAFVALDRDWRYTYANVEGARMAGRSPEQLIGRCIWDVMPRAAGTRFHEELHRAAAERKVVQFEEFDPAAGRWLEVRVYPSKGGLSIYGRDISDRKRAQQELWEQRERLRITLASIGDGVVVTDAAGRVGFLNAAAEQLTGWRTRDAVDRPLAEVLRIVDEQTRAPVESPADRALRERAVVGLSNHTLLTARDGSERAIDESAAPILGGDGRLLGAILVVRDVSERKRAEAEIRGLNRDLERRVAERTAELAAANAELQREIAVRRAAEDKAVAAGRAADEANRAKNEFLSRMSHELRTPLNAILGFGQLLEMDTPTSAQKESIQQIVGGGRHLLGLVNDVLDIARIESGRMRLSLEDVRAAEVLNAALALVRPLAAEAGVVLRVEENAAWERFVRADLQRLKQVLLNLLSNAVKYNRPGGTAAVACEMTPAGRLRIRVTDTGAGIPADKLPRLFTPFDRLDADQTASPGTGLGLAISKRLMEAMDGAIGVESAVGAGSTFWVELAAAEAPAETPIDCDPEGRSGHYPGTPATVLYIEDNPSNLRLVERVMARRPRVTLLSAIQGRLGLDMARLHRPHLIFLDLHLPDMTGAEVLHRLRDDDATRAIPVVVVSADATATQIGRMLNAGARRYLTKPIDVRELLAAMDEVLDALPGTK